MNATRTLIRTILTTLAIAGLAVSASLAQPPRGAPPAEMQAKMKAWEKWRTTHKNITSLEQTVNGLQMLERDAKTRLTKAQAKKVLPILKSWRGKAVMTDAQARTVNKQLTAPLTTAQLKKLAAMPRPGQRGPGRPGGPGGPSPDGMRGPGGPPPGGMAGPPPGGPGGPPPNGKRPTMPNPKEYNPLNPNTLPFEQMRPMAKQRLDGFIKTLAQRAG